MINREKYFMGRDIKFKSELTPELEKNAEDTIKRINALLTDLGWTKDTSVSSGWRPQQINKETPNAAKASTHTICLACDLVDDKDQTLGKLILSRPDLLKKHGLWLEDLASTVGKHSTWVHLDSKQRSARDVQVFKPA